MSKRREVVVVHKHGKKPKEQLERLQAEARRTDQQRRAFRQLQREQSWEIWGGAADDDVQDNFVSGGNQS